MEPINQHFLFVVVVVVHDDDVDVVDVVVGSVNWEK